VEEVLGAQAEEKIRLEFEQKYAGHMNTLKEQKKALMSAQEKLTQEKEQLDQVLKDKVRSQLEKEKSSILQSARKEVMEKFGLEMNSLRAEVDSRKKENLSLKKREVELLQKESDLKEQKQEMELLMQKRFLEQKEKIATDIRKQEEEKALLRNREYEKQLEDQKKLIEEMKRKAEQGSMQMQGEVMELVLADLLKQLYPFDHIEEVPQGMKGADIVQTVNNNYGAVCGKIVYESKRTKAFANDWIEKLKHDQRNLKADVAVIVTQTMPRDMETFGNKDGVWICNFSEIRGLTYVLREMVIRAFNAAAAEENKVDKMELVYSYITSVEFSQRIEAIIEGFQSMRSHLQKEKNAMQRLWAQREKEIDKVVLNTIEMYGAVKGIAGNAVQGVDILELPGREDDD
jgi:hypothetical protein